ncbi:EamA family transporter RarD [Streptomyces parvulus]|uniref:EamA family transporter RarD n=1 Tax=Streptomyces parvulus TaxID=146923 RepID=A0A369UWN0_9ACTN|nr:EamA family transporter RarD [Streptomyces parvulus]RDD85156.1 EamA family transporter RarD [Streptomyces parvulus]
MTITSGASRTGLAYGVAAYGTWGLLPLYWHLLESAGATEILAHRMAWSVAAILLILAVLRRWSWIRPLLRDRRKMLLISVAATVITVNWFTYVWSVNNGHVIETALGYFINPLVSIGLGVLVLREELRPMQWIAVTISTAAVLVIFIGQGRPPWIALILASSFGAYGLIKKRVALAGTESFAAETAVQFVPALGLLLWLGARDRSTFTTEGTAHMLLLMGCGVAASLPLIFFGAAAVRLPLSTLGMLQYLAPTLQFLTGLLFFQETMSSDRWAGFLLVWLALCLLTWDALSTARRTSHAVAGRGGRTEPDPGTAVR